MRMPQAFLSSDVGRSTRRPERRIPTLVGTVEETDEVYSGCIGDPNDHRYFWKGVPSRSLPRVPCDRVSTMTVPLDSPHPSNPEREPGKGNSGDPLDPSFSVGPTGSMQSHGASHGDSPDSGSNRGPKPHDLTPGGGAQADIVPELGDITGDDLSTDPELSDAELETVPVDAATRAGRLLAKARGLPKVPGVYLLKDSSGHVLYVGKAACLPNRVSSYFIPSVDLGYKKQPMLDVVEDFDVIPCEGEWEALLLESRLVKDTRPRFNAKLTDDKSFPYLAVTMRDEFPGVYITRIPSDDRFKGAKVYGPFTSVASLRHAIQLLQRVFQFRTCEMEIRSDEPKNRFFRPCLLHAIRQCTAPCANRVTPEAYRADIERFVRFLGGKRSQLLKELTEEMTQAAGQLSFERAATLRDQIKAIQKLDERERRSGAEYDWQPEVTIFSGDPSAGLRSLQRTLGVDRDIRCLEAIDIAHLVGGDTVGSKVCFIDGRPLKSEYRRYRVTSVDNDDYSSIREVVSRRYRDAGAGQELYPDIILIDGGLGQLHAALEAFEQLDVKPPMVISLAKKEELIYVQRKSEPIRLGREHLGLRLCQAIRDEAHRFAQHYHHLLRSKRVLDEAVKESRRPPRSKRGGKRSDGPRTKDHLDPDASNQDTSS
jgi:excinuclease ABC subunit C